MSNLDPATFELAGSSHIVNTQLTPNGEIRFNFFNIMLPDSGADLEGSKGWVLFRVNPDASLPDPTEITNTAHIVFDQNSPIVTNTTLNTMTALQYPQSGFNTADVSICETDCIFYNNQSASGTSYNWSFPGGSPSSSTAASPGAICYSTTGSYDVTLITTNALGSDTLTQASYINVAVSPVIFSVVQLGDTLIAPQGYASYQWYYNNVAIANDTLYYHVATQNGDYGVIVSNPNGCESGVNIPGVITGIEDDLSALNNLEVYPNPSTGAFEISFLSQGVQKVKIEFYDNVGRVIEANTILSTNGLNKFAFNSYELSSGIYTLKLTDNSKSVTKIVLIK
jgi:PKD repeat protein